MRRVAAAMVAAVFLAATWAQGQQVAGQPEEVVGTALPPPPVSPVRLSVNRDQIVFVSKLSVGITETHQSADHKDALPEPAERGTALTRQTARWQNTHIQGWGAGVIEPKPGVCAWVSMDRRIAFMRKQGIPIVITLCTAPGWMKTTGGDWDMGSGIKPEMNGEFAKLCVAVAKRYPDVRYFQVWNEFKGYWNKAKNEWDVEGYTTMYNVVYDALKAHDPTLKVGGFYLVVAGTGSSVFGYNGPNTFTPMPENQKGLLRYWTKNRHGADFVCVDKGIPDYHDKNVYPEEALMALTGTYQKVTREVAELSGGLPVWWSEFYSYGRDAPTNLVGAAYASAYLHALLGGATTALMWNPNEGELNCYLYTDVRKPDGGRPVEHFTAFEAMSKHFGPGTEIVATTSASKWVELLASTGGAVMIVNKWKGSVTVELDGRVLPLKPYEIRVLTPALP
jgi:hypothetical protein